MTKDEEIKLLTKLCNSDSYFSQYFGKSLDLMINNINNDVAIENGLPFEAKETFLKHEIKTLESSILSLELIHKDEIAEKEKQILAEKMGWMDFLLVKAEELKDDGLEIMVIEEIGLDMVLKRKRILELKLSETQIDYLISKI